MQAWEVTRADLMFPLNLLVDLSQVVHKLFLSVLFNRDIGHLLLERVDAEMDLGWCVRLMRSLSFLKTAFLDRDCLHGKRSWSSA